MSKTQPILYANATLRQFARAIFQYPHPIHQKISYGKSYAEIVANLAKRDAEEAYHSYNKKGALTLVGKAKRLTDLKTFKLSKNATVQEFLDKSRERMSAGIDDILRKIENYRKKHPKG